MVKMANKEHMCFFHWIQTLNRHTKQLIILDFHDEHKVLCYDYKKATSLEEADLQHVTIGCDGTHLELHAKLPFTSSIIGSACNTFVCNNGEASCWM
jgi:hypothetical protein